MSVPPFFQEPPHLSPEYTPFFRSLLSTFIPPEIFRSIDEDLLRFSKRVTSEIHSLHEAALRSPPEHVPYSPWGVRIDDVRVSEGWLGLHRVAAEEGLVAIGYERKTGEYSRLHQFAKLFLYHPSSAFYTCPLAMTDGAARIIEILGGEHLKSEVGPRLTTRDSASFWTSGQWMTEREGGSDVSNSATRASAQSGRSFLLNGEKWFSSATTSDIAFTLAKIEGSQQLSMFMIKLRDSEGRLNGIRVNRLKDKLGTKALPTAELTLSNTVAELVGEAGSGVKNIATMLNITRMYNSVCSLGQMNRCVHLSNDFAKKRSAFGAKIGQHALHQQTLAEMNLYVMAGLHLVTFLLHLLGKDELGKANEGEKQLIRLLIPIAKMTTAKHAVAVASECVESFGGAGYVEDTGLPLMLRDAQVFPIWEGTTNILSLDVMRVYAKSPQIFESYFAEIERRLALKSVQNLGESLTVFTCAVSVAKSYIQNLSQQNIEQTQRDAKGLAFYLGAIFSGALMLEYIAQTSDSEKTRAIEVFAAWSDKISSMRIQNYFTVKTSLHYFTL